MTIAFAICSACAFIVMFLGAIGYMRSQLEMRSVTVGESLMTPLWVVIIISFVVGCILGVS